MDWINEKFEKLFFLGEESYFPQGNDRLYPIDIRYRMGIIFCYNAPVLAVGEQSVETI